MPYGPGTYGSKVGRPKKKKSMTKKPKSMRNVLQEQKEKEVKNYG